MSDALLLFAANLRDAGSWAAAHDLDSRHWRYVSSTRLLRGMHTWSIRREYTTAFWDRPDRDDFLTALTTADGRHVPASTGEIAVLKRYVRDLVNELTDQRHLTAPYRAQNLEALFLLDLGLTDDSHDHWRRLRRDAYAEIFQQGVDAAIDAHTTAGGPDSAPDITNPYRDPIHHN